MTDDDHFAEASAWHFRLQADDASAQERQAFAVWLGQSEAHRQAWAEAQTLLAALQPAALGMQAGAPVRPSPSPRRSVWAAAALLVISLGIAWQTPWPERLGADYYTGVGESRTLVLADGSRLQLNTDTALSVDFSGAERRVRLLRGEAWFEVTHDASRPFVVDSAGGQVRVLGTRFSVARIDGQTRVQLAQGSVEVLASGGAEVVITPGQAVDIDHGQLAVSRYEPGQAFAWRQRQLVFAQRPLGEVIAELNRYWPGHLMIVDAGLEQRRVSGVFEIDKPAAVLRALELTLGLQVEHFTAYLTVLRAAKAPVGT